ncbi:hypothetical protein NX784_11030 [Massilia pinisoli]|uniref:HEPN domain-containing protein n=1 Tax=Massilia pinisoli TaxID=1772194 RepID=A0ABT1ZQF6_9BURK|nr:hypothetical protein [Massilia pinisoli]MCS0582125.1 hypothetical protein [Massilia pinisoli]
MRKEPSGHIYRHAMQFYKMAAPAFEDNAVLEECSMAVVCNLALCCELLLKCADAGVDVPSYKKDVLLSNAEVYSNLKGGGHDLKKMFERMDQDIAKRLSSLYCEVTGKDLAADLDKCKDYFVHARYAYELQSTHPYSISDIKNLVDGLNQALWKGWGPST